MSDPRTWAGAYVGASDSLSAAEGQRMRSPTLPGAVSIEATPAGLVLVFGTMRIPLLEVAEHTAVALPTRIDGTGADGSPIVEHVRGSVARARGVLLVSLVSQIEPTGGLVFHAFRGEPARPARELGPVLH